ncbi:MAG: hypothetical protein WC353_01705 [Candidatus Peribacter sp.]|jgi:hypothetical protein
MEETTCELCGEPICELCGGCQCEENACTCDTAEEEDKEEA